MADDGSILVSDLPPDQQQQLLAPPSGPPGLDIVGAAGSAEELADVSIQTKGQFDPAKWASENPKASPDLLQKAADANAVLRSRGFNWHDINLKDSIKGVGEVVKGAAQYSGKALQLGVVNPVADLVTPKLAPKAQKEFEKQRAKDSAELVSATESAQFGLGDLVRKGAEKISRWAGKAYQKLAVDPSLMPSFMKDPLDQTPKERLDALWGEVGIIHQKENITRGHGAAAETVLGKVIADLEAAGGKVDPQAVEVMAAGDPITFAAFGQGFKVGAVALAGTAKAVIRPIATFASKLPAVEAMAALQAAQKSLATAGAAVKTAEKGAATTGEEAGRLEGLAESGASYERELVGGGIGTFSPTVNADLNAAATAANAARRAEAALVDSQTAAGRAAETLADAEARVAATPGTGLVQKVSQIPAAVVKAKDAVGAAVGGTVERGVDIALGFVPGVVGAGARTAEMVGKVVSGILPPIATPHYVRVLTGKMGAIAEESFTAAGQLVKGDVRAYSPRVGVASSIAQAVPTVAAEAAKGFAVDVALAAVTSEKPADTVNMPVFMTTFGAAKGLGLGAARGVERQLIGARNVGSDTGSAARPYNRFSALDAANKFSVDQAKDPDVVKRLSAVRDFNKGTGAQMYWVPEEATVKKLLQRYAPGLDEARYDEMAQQQAVYLTLKDDAGATQKVGIFRDLDAAPHESGHAAQDVLGERAMSGIDDIVYDEYAHVWDQVGNNYARRFFSGLQMADAAARGEGWQEAVLDLSLGTADWRGQLTTEQINGMANHYLAREISAEAFDALFKHGGPELLQNKSLPGKLARILGKTLSGMGIEPFQDFRTEGQGLPLSMKTAEELRGRFKSGVDAAAVEAARPNVEAIPPYGATPKKGKAPVVSPRGETPPTSEITPTTPTPPPTPKGEAERVLGLLPEIPDEPVGRGKRSQRAILNDVADAIGREEMLDVDYRHAKGTVAANVASGRAARRAEIERARGVPLSERDDPSLTAIFPTQVFTLPSGQLQLWGWSPDVFTANAHKLARALTDAKETRLSPYEIDKKTGTFTTRGWQELFIDATNFSRNQRAGLTGAGNPLAMPADTAAKGFYPPPVQGEAGASLSTGRADVMNALFGIPIPKTPRIGEVYPRNLRGQEVSEETTRAAGTPDRTSDLVKPRAPFSGKKAEARGIEGRTLREVNPFRAELEAKGIRPDFIEAFQRLSLENIADVKTAAPTATELRGNLSTLDAGFQPKKGAPGETMRFSVKKDEPRAIKSAAIQIQPSGKIVEGYMHVNAYEKAYADGSLKEGHFPVDQKVKDGFVTNAGEFLDRDAAFARATELKQLTKTDAKTLNKDARAGYGDENSLEAVTFDGLRRFSPKLEDVPEKDRGPGKEITVRRPDGSTYQAMDQGPAEGFENGEIVTRRAIGIPVAGKDGGVVKMNHGLMPKDHQIVTEEGAPQPDWRVVVQAPVGEVPGYVQLENPRQQERATTVEDLRKAGHDVPDFSGLPQGRYTYAEATKLAGEGAKFSPSKAVTNSGKELEKKGFKFDYRPGKENPEIQILSVEKGKDPVGRMEISFSDEGRKAHVEWVTVSPKFRQQGIGEALYREMASRLQKQKVHILSGDLESMTPYRIRNRVFGEFKNVADEDYADSLYAEHVIEPDAKFSPKPNEDVRTVAEDYVGKDKYRPVGAPVDVNVAHAKKLAEFYDTAKHDPTDPEVKASYDALAKETLAQYKAIDGAGYALEPFTGKGEPYKNSDEMTADVRDNKHLFFKPTDTSFSGEKDHPMLHKSGIDDLSVNDLFRGVHDFFGHAKEGYQFGQKGELNAWRAHSEMYSDEAQGALAAETLAQNSWVNFGKHLRDSSGNVAQRGEKGFVSAPDRPFAEQKATIVPQELIDETKARFAPKKGKEDPLKFKSTGGSPSKAWILPDGTVAQLGAMWHEAWLRDRPEVTKKYGIKISDEADESNRPPALIKGFARVNYEPASGRMTVEARQKDWRKVKGTVQDLAAKNLDDIEKMSIHVLDEKADRPVDSAQDDYLFRLSDKDKESAISDMIDSIKFSPKDAGEKYVHWVNPTRSVLNRGRETIGPIPADKAEFVRDKVRAAGAADGQYLQKTTVEDSVPEGFGAEDNPFWQAVEAELDKTRPPTVEPRKLRET